MKLTQTILPKLALPRGITDKIFFDDDLPGFGLRIRAGGSRKYVLHYRLGSAQRRHTIGPAAVLTLEEARKKARKLLVAIDDGKDPAAERDGKRAAASLRFGDQVEAYLLARQTINSAAFPILRPHSFAQIAVYLRQSLKDLHKHPVAAIQRQTIAAELRAIATDAPVAADRARSAVSTFYAWLIGEGLCDTNPVVGTNKASDGTPRERVLTDAELVAIWQATPETDFGRIVRLLMLTAQRRDEIGSLRWSEIVPATESGGPLIAFPAERTKNGRPHDVPLSPAAAAVLDPLPRIVGRELVFGIGAGGFAGWSRAKAVLDKTSGVSDWTLHDLRRTAATRMADLGVLPHVIEAVLNHVSGHKAGVAGIYNRSTYAPEKRAALNLWADRIRLIVAKASGANVTELRKLA